MERIAKAAVTPVRQRTQYSCMAASMAMCLNALGYKTDEDEVNRVMGAKPMRGAAWEEALACAQHFGCRATLTVPATVRQLKAWIDAGTPVMIAWNPEGREWSHASVVFDVTEDSTGGLLVHVADPNIPNPEKTVRVVTEDEFYSKWYEKWPSYLVRRPACAIEREVTPEGRQVVASNPNGEFLPKMLLRVAAMDITRGRVLRFRKNQAFGRAFRFQRGDTGIVDKAYPDGALGFWTEKYPNLPFLIRAEDVAEMVEIVKQTVSPWPDWAEPQKMAGQKDWYEPITIAPEDMPKKRRGPEFVEQVLRRPGGGSHHTRERDLAKGRSRKQKHKRNPRDIEASETPEFPAVSEAERKVSDRFLSALNALHDSLIELAGAATAVDATRVDRETPTADFDVFADVLDEEYPFDGSVDEMLARVGFWLDDVQTKYTMLDGGPDAASVAERYLCQRQSEGDSDE